ncbi:MAG: DNA polymerase III [Spirochaetaceae bacterium]
MFDNIIGHAEPLARLRAEILGNRLPAAVLFHGPQYAGKTTVALELARAVTCEQGGAEWTCTCDSCRRQRMLVHPYTLLLGTHYFLQEITVCAEALKAHPSKGTRFLFLRAVRKLLRRFDEVLWQGQEHRISSVSHTVREVGEMAEDLDPRFPLPQGAELEKVTERLRSRSKKLASALPQDPVPIQAVRNVAFWAHMSGPRKVVIVDGADRLNGGTRNALLKTLEEPPPEVTFVLLATARSAVMPTILSRVRQYEFRPRSTDEQCEVVRRVFREGELECGSLREYFLNNGFSGSEPITSLAEAFIEAVVSPHTADGADGVAHVQQTLQEMAEVHAFRYFFEELTALLQRLLANDATRASRPLVGMETIGRWRDLVAEAAFRVESLNMNPSTVCESLYFSMRQVDAGVH